MTQRQAIRVGTIENAGPNTLVSFLRSAGMGCAQIDIAVAFITASGLDSLLYLLKQAASRGSVRVLTGLYQGFTEPRALTSLLREQDRTDGRLSVRISDDARFHWKSYMLVKRETARVVIGSSNLTSDGLHESGELNVVLTLGRSSREFVELRQVFEQHWQRKSALLTNEIVEKYQHWRNDNVPSVKHRAVPIRRILAGKPGKVRSAPTEVRYWRTCIDGHLEDETEDLLATATDWERRGYWYFSTWRRSFRVGDRIVLFHLSDRYMEAMEIKDTTRTPVRTPDGLHFAACLRLRGIGRRRLTPNRWKMLKAGGLLKRKDDCFVTTSLKKEHFDLFLEQLRKS